MEYGLTPDEVNDISQELVVKRQFDVCLIASLNRPQAADPSVCHTLAIVTIEKALHPMRASQAFRRLLLREKQLLHKEEAAEEEDGWQDKSKIKVSVFDIFF